jgi:aspartate kinase
LQDVVKEIGAREVTALENIAKVSIIGIGMRSHSGVAATMFDTLAKAGVNIEMISTSEIKISVIIQLLDAEKAARAIHDAFHLTQ